MEQRLQDLRAYKMMSIHLKDPPHPSVIFPMLEEDGNEDYDSEDDEIDDEFIFHAVTASLGSANGLT